MLTRARFETPRFSGNANDDIALLARAIREYFAALDAPGSLEVSDARIATTNVIFPATQVPSSDANTLDDYEEGTWTPVLTFTTPGDLNVVYSTQAGFYEKIGSMVTVRWSIFTSTFTHSTAAGSYTITGLPFTSLNVTGSSAHGALAYRGITKAGFTQFGAEISAGEDTIRFQGYASGVSESTVVVADVPSGTAKFMRGTIVYRAAA